MLPFCKIIKRKCSLCEKSLEVLIDGDNKITGGNYFGKLEVPIGKGEYVKIGTSRLLGRKTDIVKWTGKTRTVEYWECDRCYKE